MIKTNKKILILIGVLILLTVILFNGRNNFKNYKQEYVGQSQLEQNQTQKINEDWVIVNENDLLRRLEKSDKIFRRYEIGDMIIYKYQRMIDNAIVEFDYIRYVFDKNTQEFKEKDIHWRDDLPEHLPLIISKEQAESIAGGGSATLYFISPESDVFPIKPTSKNPCWIVRTIDDSKIIDAVKGKMLGYGISPPKP